MVSLFLVRLAFIVICGLFSFTFGGENPLQMTIAGCGIAAALVVLESTVRRISLKGLSAGVFGIVLGLILARFFGHLLGFVDLEDDISPFLVM